MTMAGLRVRLLGELQVEGFETIQLGSRKARSLVRMLAVHRGPRFESTHWPIGCGASTSQPNRATRWRCW